MGQTNSFQEVIITSHNRDLWVKRREERKEWNAHSKRVKKEKELVSFRNEPVDAELYETISLLNQIGIETEYSCAGVSLLDDPINHSLYAYITFKKDSLSERFTQFLIHKSRHRVLVSFEEQRNRYDISSFFIQHNRSFCLLIHHYTKQFVERFKA